MESSDSSPRCWPQCHTRLALSLIIIVTGFLATLGLATLPTHPAHADEPTLAEAKRQVDALSEKMVIANENYNQVRDQLDHSKARQGQLQQQSDELKKRHDQLQSEVGDIAAVAYEGGSLSNVNTILNSKSPQALLDQLSYLDLLNSQRQDTIEQLTKARTELRSSKKQIDNEVTKQSDQESQLSQQKAQLQADLEKWEKLRDKLSPTTSRNLIRPTYQGQATGDAEIAVKFAYNQIGKSYEFGADGPDSYDCSGLTMAAWRQAGVSLPHSSKSQYNAIPRKVAREDLEPGDIVIFYSDLHHAAIYIGDGQVIHASQPGEPVKVAPMSAMPYYGAVRP